jgi:membrane-bound lytic murein transglycosylase D
LKDIEFQALSQPPQFAEDTAGEEAEPALIDEINDAPIPDDFSIAENREARLRATKSDLPLVLNSHVIQFINYFTGRGRKTMMGSLERAEAYRPMIERALAEEGVPLELIHLAQAESGFRPKARSRARATGMWQFMAFRGEQYGLRRDRSIDERYDPEKATVAAAQHLQDLYIEFGDWYLALAAYNSGPMRVKRAIERAGSRDYWTLLDRKFLPRETRNYVPIIVAMIYVAKNLDMYGFDKEEMTPAEEIVYDTVEVDSEIHLELIADITGSAEAEIKELNPALLRSATPPFPYELRLPQGAGETFATHIALIPEDQRLAWRRHRVRPGESLDSIAKQYSTEEAQIASLNSLDRGALTADQWLTIPARARKISYFGGSAGGAGGLVEGGGGRYRIASGDNLGAIARRFGVSVSQLQGWNGLSGNRIVAGRYLIVDPDGSRSASSGRAPSGSSTYRIRPGDTLAGIAQRHGVSISELQAWNRLRGNTVIAGRTLVVGEKRTASTGGAPSSATAVREPDTTAVKYRIRNGDNLAAIAKRHEITVDELMAWNGLRSSSIQAGDSLTVRAKTPSTAAGSIVGVARAASEVPASTQRYQIRRGDTLATIAQRFEVTVEQLRAWNGLRSHRITAGEYLIVRVAASTAQRSLGTSQRAAASKPTRYKIRRGDSLEAIAQRFGVTVDQLKAWNSLRGSRINVGDYLTVGSPEQAQAGASPAGS